MKSSPKLKPLKDERATVLAKYSPAFLELVLLDRALDRTTDEIFRLEEIIDQLQAKQDRRIAERKKLRQRVEREQEIAATTRRMKGGAA